MAKISEQITLCSSPADILKRPRTRGKGKKMSKKEIKDQGKYINKKSEPRIKAILDGIHKEKTQIY